MSPLSQAQFDMVRRGSEATVNQTRPILGTIKKVADALGYQLGRKTEERVTLDEHGNRVRGRVQTSQGFGTTTTAYDTNGITGEDMSHSGVPGPLGGRRTTTVIKGQNPNPMPGYGPHPYQPSAPGPTPAGPTTPFGAPRPFGPPFGTGPAAPAGPQPAQGQGSPIRTRQTQQTVQSATQALGNALRNRPQQQQQPRGPFYQPPQPVDLSQPLPFNGSPKGRSDYGNSFGTP